MIQRVQTLWLLLAAIAAFVTLKFSFYSGTLLTDNSYHHLMATDNLFLMVLTSALGSGLVINIFLYKYRSLQTKICFAALVVELIIVSLYIVQLKNYSNGTYDLWAAFHILILIGIIMSLVGIRKDEKLLKESNRLR